MSLPYRGGTGPLNLVIDSTGIKAEGESEWTARKHGGPKRRIWRKIHIGIDEETLEVRAIKVTTSTVGDAPMLPELPNQIPADQTIGSVTADGAYDTRRCHDVIAARNAHAVIPPRKNAKPWKPTSAGAIARNEAVNASRYLGRAIWRRWSGYHRRSRVGTKMHCVKCWGRALWRGTSTGRSRKFRSALPFSTATPLLAYLLLRSQAKSVRGKGKHVPHLICATKLCRGETKWCTRSSQ